VGRADGFVKLGSERHGKDGGFIGSDLPAHYHVSKGSNFKRIFFGDKSLRETVEYVVNSDRYGMGVMCNYPKENKEMGHEQQFWYYWLAEENYTSEKLWDAIKAGQIKFHGRTYNNESERVYRWNTDSNDYVYDPQRVRRKSIVDIHCCQVRPYGRQAEALDRLIKHSGLL
jgi:hypothetical protein